MLSDLDLIARVLVMGGVTLAILALTAFVILAAEVTSRLAGNR